MRAHPCYLNPQEGTYPCLQFIGETFLLWPGNMARDCLVCVCVCLCLFTCYVVVEGEILNVY